MPKLRAPDNVSGCSYAGVAYPVSEGLVEVPDAAVVPLCERGFSRIAEPTEAKPEDGKPEDGALAGKKGKK